ncbi:hypothetical protein [Undibacterium terreum]|uniref:Uncharacterized protein n=1 Tax=Undibacterium terreum TaxID=1224302 RepID=A0A916XER0_9BURK|nr:hypothetical protein [Undibacterium terreum]GGC66492.1 hypothetical protein GCM10011396_11960 [Undibacterium terreum]
MLAIRILFLREKLETKEKSRMVQIVHILFLGIISWLAAPVLGIILWLFKFRKTAAGVVMALFMVPFILMGVMYNQILDENQKFKEDVAYEQALCAKYGGDKIYKTVENVEGIFRINERHPDYDSQLRDQFGMIDPYGNAQGDPSSAGEFLNDQRIASKRGYIYAETQIKYDSKGPPYKRFYLKPTGKKIGDKYPGAENRLNPELEIVEEQVAQLASHYGYVIDDLSTRELRERWIGGGRIRIIDLRTNEVLAERIGYFRAPGMSVPLHWAASGLSVTDHFCPQGSSLKQFLHSVLKPVQAQITPAYSDF